MRIVSEQSQKQFAAEKETYANNKPFAHIVIEDFLEEEFFQQLVEDSINLTFYGKESDLFSFAQTNDLHQVHKTTPQDEDMKHLHSFIDFIDSEKYSQLLNQITGLSVKAGSTDLFAAIYQDADYLLCHDDQLEDRAIAWILYLTEMNEDEGGELILYEDENGEPGKVAKKMRPKKNSLVIFTVSDKSWHEVAQVKQAARVSIGGWMHE